ncbi:Ribokinase [Camellia lanceoleosa]|uniref:Ribokinase n=1 Tax=Camellia lanceoleosa TaxID=1840588 RepID=A0ACC0HIF4_9ERIC|nr:Ribokinase [Camellia lanceoleosa]
MQTSMWRSIDSQERERQSQPRLAKHLLVAKGLIRLYVGENLHTQLFFVGQIGEDAHGKLISDALEDCGVVLDRLRNVSGAPTGHAVVMLQSDGQNSIIIVGGANMSCWPDAMCDEDLEVVRNAGLSCFRGKSLILSTFKLQRLGF